MKPSLITSQLDALYTADIQKPIMLWGPPGVGKSEVIRQLAESRGMILNDVRTILLDPVDLRGLPYVDKDTGVAHQAIPDFLPPSNSDEHFLLFLDELTSAPKQVQGACYQLILDGKIGNYTLPKNCQIVAAGNRKSDRGVVNEMPVPLKNRFVHIDFELDFNDWLDWATTKNPNTVSGTNIAPEIISFIRFKPDALHDMQLDQNAFPTPRTWEYVSDIIPALQKASEFDMIQGTIGEGYAGEFLAFLRIWRELPNPDAVIMNPTKAEVPEDPATLYALMGALSTRANEVNFDNVATYAARVPTEFQVILVRDAIQREPDICNTPSFSDWADKNQKTLRAA